ncbi:thiamine transporter membrane protein [compost metagenome]
MNLRNVLRYALVLFLLFPFLFLLTQFRLGSAPDWAELRWAFKNTFYQAFLSTVLSLFFGLWSALGLISFSSGRKRHWRFPLDILCLLPNFLPPIFILLATLNTIEPFPMGIVGIALVHAFMNFGLVAVLLAGIIESKLGGVVELSYVEGASRWQFFSRAFFPILKKDILLICLFVFVICFGSFSVPLVVGGGRGTTVEVLIYEKIRLSGEWGDAVILAFLQSLFIFAVTFIANRGRAQSIERWANLKLIRMPSGIAVLLLISALYMYGYGQSFIAGLPLLATFSGMQSALLWSFTGSLLMGLTVGLLCYGGLMLIAYSWPKRWFEKFLNGYVAPSTSLACFSLLILGPNEGWMPFIKIPLALTLLSLNSLFRMGWDGELHSLQSQVTVAHTMGASHRQIFKEILFPQLANRAGLLAGIASVWACGDFAVSRILAHQDLTIAMMTETLMTSYRLSQATVLSSLIVLASLICFIFFVGGSRVLRRKLVP